MAHHSVGAPNGRGSSGVKVFLEEPNEENDDTAMEHHQDTTPGISGNISPAKLMSKDECKITL